MPVLAPERVERIVDAWRKGVDTGELENPAGPLFDIGGFAEYDITMTGGGGGTGGPGTTGASMAQSWEIISCVFPPQQPGDCGCD